MCLTIFPKGCGEDPVAKGAVSHFKFYQMYCKAAFFFFTNFHLNVTFVALAARRMDNKWNPRYIGHGPRMCDCTRV